MHDFLATTPEPPYYAVVFTTVRSSGDTKGYAETDARLEALAREQPGFLGVESTGDGRRGITVSYWSDEASIRAWREHVEHAAAQRRGRERWYDAHELRVAKVERTASYSRSESRSAATSAADNPPLRT